MTQAGAADLFCILYHSREALPANAGQAGAELTRILEASHRNNAEQDVTGVLMFGHGSFVQAIEGPQATVRETFDRILADQRHRELTVLHMDRIDERAFSAWSMATISDWDGSNRTRTVLDAVTSPEQASPSRSTLLNFLLGMLLRQAGRDWKPLPEPLPLKRQA
jgi:hypothetical protein